MTLCIYFFDTLGALLVCSFFLQSLCQDERVTPTVDIKKNNSGNNEQLISKDVINVNGETTGLADSSKVSIEEKGIEIQQQDLGKTRELNDAEEKEDDTKVENKNGEENKEVKQEKQDDKEKEPEIVEEQGIDLKVLNDNDFEHLTQAATGATTGDWLVLFTKKDNCDECSHAEKEMKIVYERVKHKINIAKVVHGRSAKMTFKRFNIEKTMPVISFFRQGKRFAYKNNVSVDDLIKFLDGGFELASWTAVREPYTLFEYYVEESVEELKDMVRYKKNVTLIIFFAGFICGISVISLCGSIIFHLFENFKDDDGVYMNEAEICGDLADLKSKDD